MLETYTRLLRLDPLTPRQRRQARLSAFCGGLGLRGLHEHREAAWVGSWLGTLPRVRAGCPAGWASQAELERAQAWA